MADTGGNLKRAPREILPGVRVYPNPAEVARGGGAAVRGLCLAVDCASTASSWWRFPAETRREMLFEFLASDEFRGQVDWAKVHVFWSDERAVPPDDPRKQLRNGPPRTADPRADSAGQRAPHGGGEKPNIGRAAHEYEEVLREYLALDDAAFRDSI